MKAAVFLYICFSTLVVGALANNLRRPVSLANKGKHRSSAGWKDHGRYLEDSRTSKKSKKSAGDGDDEGPFAGTAEIPPTDHGETNTSSKKSKKSAGSGDEGPVAGTVEIPPTDDGNLFAGVVGISPTQAAILNQLVSSDKADVHLFLDGERAIDELIPFVEGIRSTEMMKEVLGGVSDRMIIESLMGPTMIDPALLDDFEDDDFEDRRELLNIDRNNACYQAAVNFAVDVLAQVLSAVSGIPGTTAKNVMKGLLQKISPNALLDFQRRLLQKQVGGSIPVGELFTQSGKLALNIGGTMSFKEIFAEVLANMDAYAWTLFAANGLVHIAALFSGAGALVKWTSVMAKIIDGLSLLDGLLDLFEACDESPEPTSTPTSRPTTSDQCLDDPCCANPSDCDVAGENGDPHLVTFDNLRYSCQGRGDFVLFQSATSGIQVQSHFQRLGDFVSVCTGFAATTGFSGRTIELSVVSEGNTNEVELYIDGNKSEAVGGFEDDEFRLTVRSTTFSTVFTTFLKTSKLSVVSELVGPRSSPRLEVSVRVPSSLRGEDINGLLGSPDDFPFNDWTTKEGNVLEVLLLDREEFEYCTTEWCVSDFSDSLFTYDDESTFSDLSGCNEPYPGSVDLDLASQELRDLCGNDQACLTDGIELGIEGAQSLLEAEAELGSTSASTAFQVAPSIVVVDEPTNIILTVDLSASTETAVQEFAIFRTNSVTFTRGSVPLVMLYDIGLGKGDDSIAGDKIFSNVLAVESPTAGDSLSFQAVPVIDGNLAFNSPMVYTALNAVRVYSEQSGIRIDGGTGGIIEVNDIEGLILFVEYTWPLDQYDLDTSTSFLGDSVGFLCGADVTDYLAFAGDDMSSGGKETVEVSVGKAFEENASVNQVSIGLNAHWFDESSRGPATVTAYTGRRLQDGRLQTGNNAVSFVMRPRTNGSGLGCATHTVGSVDIALDSESGGAKISVFPSN